MQSNSILKCHYLPREAAYTLVAYFRATDHLEFYPAFDRSRLPHGPLTIIELGSGTGLVARHVAHNLRSADGDLLLPSPDGFAGGVFINAFPGRLNDL